MRYVTNDAYSNQFGIRPKLCIFYLPTTMGDMNKFARWFAVGTANRYRVWRVGICGWPINCELDPFGLNHTIAPIPVVTVVNRIEIQWFICFQARIAKHIHTATISFESKLYCQRSTANFVNPCAEATRLTRAAVEIYGIIPIPSRESEYDLKYSRWWNLCAHVGLTNMFAGIRSYRNDSSTENHIRSIGNRVEHSRRNHHHRANPDLFGHFGSL